MVRYIILGILGFLCYCCHDEGSGELQGAKLSKQIHDTSLFYSNSYQKVDSLVKLSVELSPVERYAVLFNAVVYRCKRNGPSLDSLEARSYDEQTKHYLRLLDSLPFPKVRNKADGFLLLSCYDNVWFELMEFSPRLIDPAQITSLLFDMENRWRLTPQEKLRFLVIKSGIYFNIFKEYKSALLIVKDGLQLARECGADQKIIMSLFKTLLQSSLQFRDTDQIMALGEDFMELAESCQFDSLARKTVYGTIGSWYELQGDYHKAYDCLDKIGNPHSDKYLSTLARVYAGVDSFPAALDYIEYWRNKKPHTVILAIMAWDEAFVRQKMGDHVGYEHCLRESVKLFDSFNRLNIEIDNCAPSEAYARLLWQQGKFTEAIRRMELVNEKLASKSNYNNTFFSDFYNGQSQMNRLRLLRTYYNNAGCTADALRQSLLCDSLEQQLTKMRLQAERRKTAMAAYTMDLLRNLELRAKVFQKEQQKFYLTCSMLGMALLGIVVLFVLYRRRERQLNILYTRQKEIEQLQAEKHRMVAAESDKLSPEEQLFRELERQFYENEFFRNPGFSRDDLCRLGGSNRMYVSTCINKYAGTNINQWINKARIDYAIRLIGEGEDDLTKLSEMSGFSSIKSFFRSFKQFTSLTPRQYIVRDKQKKE